MTNSIHIDLLGTETRLVEGRHCLTRGDRGAQQQDTYDFATWRRWSR